jgi:hypothetical protein
MRIGCRIGGGKSYAPQAADSLSRLGKRGDPHCDQDFSARTRLEAIHKDRAQGVHLEPSSGVKVSGGVFAKALVGLLKAPGSSELS